ncbi:MAG: 2,3-bisphosphoglycerate-independent phosphoglycerate mutase [Bacilli bacterium]
MKPTILIILDGVGIRKEIVGNAFKQANKPTLDYLWSNYSHCLLKAAEQEVGLPIGQMGNSEVGHMNIGAGRIVYQPLQLINEKIKEKYLFKNQAILEVMDHVKKNNSQLHIFGLLSDGGIHSHINHLLSLLDMAKEENIKQIYLHMFLDGRDTLQRGAIKYLDQLNEKIKDLKIGQIATISGRYYAMDRDNRPERLRKAYDAIVYNKGEHYNNYQEVISTNYKKNITDEFIAPAILVENSTINDNDGLLVFNFRPDRLRELFGALTNPCFHQFATKRITNLKLTTMFPVSEEVISKSAFKLDNLKNTLGEYLSIKGLSQLRIAETEKYAHVTYFFNGGLKKQLKNCDEILIPSSKVATYDLDPAMGAYQITDILLKKMEKYDFIVLNFANGDMVGHTGNMLATIRAIEVIDQCLAKIYQKITAINGLLVITADHGNSEYMFNDNNIITSHTMSKVPFIINRNIALKDGKLADIAPTILELMKIKKPVSMTGESLIEKVEINT